jgi:cell division septation protein DedD
METLNFRFLGSLAALLVLLAGPSSGFCQDAPLHPDTSGSIVAVYAIQVGAFAVAENARALAASLTAKGFDPVIYDNLIDGKRMLHLVWVGRFDTPADAAPALERIRKLTGIEGVLREQMIWRKKK